LGIFDGVLLAADIDGTLLNRKHELTAPVRAALESFTARGGLFTVATGRSFAGFAALRPLVPLNAPVILSNGAYIYDYAVGRELHTEWLSGPFEEALHDIQARFPGLGTELHWPGRVAVMNYNRWNEVHMTSVRCTFDEIKDPSDAPPPWLKLLFVDEHETLKEVAGYAISRYKEHFSFVFSAKCLLEMQNAGVNKAVGVKMLAEMLSLDEKNVYTAGDAGNDLGMLRAYESFAPASGTAEARAAASHTVPSCDEDAMAAVVAFLEQRYG
jgi:Cof subfamily protein (haloacid dehalogenase superfamily)